MTRQAHDVTHAQIERLCAGYRAGVEEPAFGAADQLLLRAATRSARYRSLQRRLCAPASLALVGLLAVLGTVAAGWFDLSGSHRPTPPATAPLTTRFTPTLHPTYVQAQATSPPVLLASTSATVRVAELPALPASSPSKNPTISPFLLGYLKAARQALRDSNYDLEAKRLEEALAARGQRTAYDDFIINSWLAVAYVNLRDFVRAVPALTAAAESPYATPAQRRAMQQAAADISAAQSTAAPGQSGAIDLNGPGALDILRSTRPEDYRRIVVILADITRHAQRDVPHWLQTDFDARDVVYQPLWLTSFPPKRRLSFSLEGQRYRAVLTITNQGARVFPVDGTTQCRAPTGVVCGDPKLERPR